MNDLHEWFNRHAGQPLTIEAFRDLQTTLGTYTPPLPDEAEGAGKSEAWAQSVVRIEASQKGLKLFRNNSGALKDEGGRLVRFGLGNDSAKANEVMKSGDLIGVRPLVILPHHVGHTFGQFVSREMKPPGWQYTGEGREAAQMRWCNLVNSCGGDAAFATGAGTL